MDDRQFDALARLVADRRTRRSAVRAVVALAAGGGALASARSSRAQQAGLLPGSPCDSTDQCSQNGGPTTCANNGYDQDGPLNCCREVGGYCEAHAWCCAAYHCIDGACVDDSATAGQAPTVAPTGEVASGELALGAACTSTAECAPTAAGVVVCGDNTVADDGPTNCCLQRGGGCTADQACCGGLSCANGFCGGPSENGNLGPGDVCQAASDCSQSLGPATCGGSKADVDGQSHCCLSASTTCSTDAECCGGLVCKANGISGDGNTNCCGDAGQACASDAACCSYLFCISGACQSLR